MHMEVLVKCSLARSLLEYEEKNNGYSKEQFLCVYRKRAFGIWKQVRSEVRRKGNGSGHTESYRLESQIDFPVWPCNRGGLNL